MLQGPLQCWELAVARNRVLSSPGDDCPLQATAFRVWPSLYFMGSESTFWR